MRAAHQEQGLSGLNDRRRGRSERRNVTWQGRLVGELRQAGIDNLAAPSDASAAAAPRDAKVPRASYTRR